MHATLRQLQILDAVVRHGGITAAARELHCTQPSVSIQLKQLGDQIGLPIFESTSRPLRLSEAGQALNDVGRQMRTAWDEFETRINDLKGLRTGRLRLAVVSTAKYFIPRLLGPFCDRYPGIDINIEVANRGAIVERLRDGLDDLTFMSRPPTDLPLQVHPFLDNPLVLIAPAGHRLATATSPVSLDAVQSERLLLRETGSGTRMAVDEFFASQNIAPTIRMEIGSNEAIKQAVAGGLGLSIISRHALRDAAGVVEIPCEGLPITSTWKIVTHAERRPSLIGQRFVDYLTDEGLQLLATTDSNPAIAASTRSRTRSKSLASP